MPPTYAAFASKFASVFVALPTCSCSACTTFGLFPWIVASSCMISWSSVVWPLSCRTRTASPWRYYPFWHFPACLQNSLAKWHLLDLWFDHAKTARGRPSSLWCICIAASWSLSHSRRDSVVLHRNIWRYGTSQSASWIKIRTWWCTWGATLVISWILLNSAFIGSWRWSWSATSECWSISTDNSSPAWHLVCSGGPNLRQAWRSEGTIWSPEEIFEDPLAGLGATPAVFVSSMPSSICDQCWLAELACVVLDSNF